MIRVRSGERRIALEGHADYAPRGQDIVCAGASALCFALLEALEEKNCLAGAEIRPGAVRIEGMGDCGAEMAMARRGLALLAERYPDHIRMEEDRTLGERAGYGS